MNTRLLMTYSEVRRAMMDAGIRDRQARLYLQQGIPAPHPHQLHSRRLWLRQTVENFCQKASQGLLT